METNSSSSTESTSTGSKEVSAESGAKANKEAQADETKFVSADEFSKVLKRVNDQSAIIEDFRKKFADTNKPKPEPKDVIEQVNDINERTKALEKREKDFEAQKITDALESQLKAGGLSEKVAVDLAKLLKLENENSFKVSNRAVKYVADDTTEKDISEWAKAFLASDRGREYVAPKRNPVSDMSQGSKDTVKTGKVTTAELRDGSWLEKFKAKTK